jgi:hypothetical protein
MQCTLTQCWWAVQPTTTAQLTAAYEAEGVKLVGMTFSTAQQKQHFHASTTH